MNRITKATAFSLLIMTSLPAISLRTAYAAGESGTINFTGKVLASTCTLDSQSLQVSMGTVAADYYGKANTLGRPVPFQVKLSHCDSALKGVKVEFDGTADSKKLDYLSVGQGGETDAKGIAIELLDDADQVVPINSVSKEYGLSAGNNALDFKARYVSIDDKVTPGDANGSAQFFLQYR
jgi:major type 1 subunit fimbrin (pilin)